MRHARLSQKKAIGNKAKNKIQVMATLMSKTILNSNWGCAKKQPRTIEKAPPARLTGL